MSNSQPSKGELRELRHALKSTMRRARKRMSDDLAKRSDAALTAIERSLKGEGDASQVAQEALELLDGPLHFARKGKVREYVESIGSALLIALALRAFVVEAFRIPTESMEPTVLIGDQLFVAKFARGIRMPFTTRYLVEWGEVERGDVIVFEFPRHEINTRNNIGALSQLVRDYARHNGGFPASLDDLQGAGLSDAELRRLSVDAWGQPLRYHQEDNTFELRSLGADGTDGTFDDYATEPEQHSRALRSCVHPDSLSVSRNYIKRVVAGPGDRIRMEDRTLYVNDEPVDRGEVEAIETGRPGNAFVEQARESVLGHTYTTWSDGRVEAFDEIQVRDGHVFVMGDNRDRSNDSRCWGQVPLNNVKGTAQFIFMSLGADGTLGVRWSRLGRLID